MAVEPGPFDLAVYASRNAGWSEVSATWNNTRALDFTSEPVAFKSAVFHSFSGVTFNFSDTGLMAYIQEALADGLETITLVVRAITPDTPDLFYFLSKEQEMIEWCSGGDMWPDGVPRNILRNSDNSFQQSADATVSQYESSRNFGFENALNVKTPVNKCIAGIYNLTGQLVKRVQWSGTGTLEIPVSDLPSGIYLLRIEQAGAGIYTQKFTKRSH